MADTGLEDERTVELSTIAAIFPELVLDESDPYHANLELPVTPLQPLRIRFAHAVVDGALPHLPTPPESVDSEKENDGRVGAHPTGEEEQELEHLPSLRVDIKLPSGYPFDKPPQIHLIPEQPWLPRPKLQELEKDCSRLWDEMGRDQVVYSYIDHLQQAAETAFNLANGSRSINMPADWKLGLLDFNLRKKREKFEQETFNCGVCLEPKKGKHCHRFTLCGHVACVPCLTDYYTKCITEGDIDNVKCTEFGCGKDEIVEATSSKKRRQDRTLNPSELLQIPLSEEFVRRYVRLKRKKKIESSKDTIYCPRRWCQGPAYAEYRQQKGLDDLGDLSESDEDQTAPIKKPSEHKAVLALPMSQRLAICADCNYAFCYVCRKTWHGSHKSAESVCNPRDPKQVNEEELASQRYLKLHSTPCPTCGAPAQKTMGCNHMMCFGCRTHFCYLCSAYLSESNPYAHYNDLKSTCYMRLWELEAGDNPEDDGPGGALGAPNPPADVGGDWNFEPSDDDQDAAVAAANVEVAVEAPVQPAVRGRAIQDDDSSDSEPAPDVRRRERAIEFVNFANPAGGRRINIPDRERNDDAAQPPLQPAVQNAQRGRGRGQVGNRRRRQENEPPHNRVPRVQQARVQMIQQMAGAPEAHLRVEQRQMPPAIADGPIAAAVEDNGIPRPLGPLPRAAPGQNNDDAAHPAPARAMGLERFLELARLDAEDEWDSDELDEDDQDGWVFADAVAAEVQAVGRHAEAVVGEEDAGVEGRIMRRQGRNRWGRRGV